MYNNRVEDLTKVFDRTWKANHNDVAKRGREKERKFMDKMFNTNRSQEQTSSVKALTPGQRTEILHNNMNSAFNGQRQNNLNNILKKWK